MSGFFTRVLWGSEDEDEISRCFSLMGQALDEAQIEHLRKRREKSGNDISQQLSWGFPLERFTVYVYGANNKIILDNLGIKNILINNSSYVLPYRNAYIHKLYAFEKMMNDFNEIVFLDWDTKLIRDIPDDFWEELNKKEVFQSSLWKYKAPKIKHRKTHWDNKFISSGGFVYMRDKTIPKRLLELHTTLPNKWSEEGAFSMLTDEMSGGWGGIEKYLKLFEPEYYRCNKGSPYLKEDKKEPCFFNRGKPWVF